MNTYRYIDHHEHIIVNDVKIDGRVVFSCLANNRIDADNAFQQTTGVFPKKIRYLTCYKDNTDVVEPGLTRDNPIIVVCQECLNPLTEYPKGWLKYNCCCKWLDYMFLKQRWYKSQDKEYVYVEKYVGKLSQWGLSRPWEPFSKIHKAHSDQ